MVLFISLAAPSSQHAAWAADSVSFTTTQTPPIATMRSTLGLSFYGVGRTLPGDTITYYATATNSATKLILSGQVSVQNSGSVAGTLRGYYSHVEYFSILQNQWIPLRGVARKESTYSWVQSPPVSYGMELALASRSAAGVSYPSSGDPVLGTSIQPSSKASWDYTSTVGVDASTIALLLDPTKVQAIRNVFHFEGSPSSGGSGQASEDKTPTPHEHLNGDLRAVEITVELPVGAPIVLSPVTHQQLARLTPGQSATVTAPWVIPPLLPKGSQESDAVYLNRLREYDGTQLSATAEAMALSSAELVRSERKTSVVTQQIPIVEIDKRGPSSAAVDTDVTYDLILRNTGGAWASGIGVTDNLPTNEPGVVRDVPSSMTPGARKTGHVDYHIPPDFSGDLTDVASVTWKDDKGQTYGPLSDSLTTTIVGWTGLPPDPSTIAPAINRSEATGLAESTSFLYSGSDAIQLDVQAESIDARRVSVLRGRVLDEQGLPLAGVRITAQDMPELGYTYSRSDGRYDFVANGGDLITLEFEKSGHLPSQRVVDAAWQEFEKVDEVAVVAFDSAATVIESNAASMQVARGSVESDVDGQRQATLLVPEGTAASMTLPGGGIQTLPNYTVRANEYTVGENGDEAMPGPLPAQS